MQLISLFAIIIALVASSCNAQANAPNAEGPIVALIRNCDACDDTCQQPTCGEVQVFVPNTLKCAIVPSTGISFSSGAQTFEQLMSTTPFPGRNEPGWIGGTSIFFAEEQIINGVETSVCTTVNVEIAENVLVGTCSVTDGVVVLAGVQAIPVDDPEGRIVGANTDDLGFPIDITTVPPNTVGCSLEGYASLLDGFFHYQLFSVPSGVATLLPDAPFIAVSLAQCRGADQLRLLGGTRGQFAIGAVIEVFLAPKGVPNFNLPVATTAVSEDAGVAGFGSWRLRDKNLPGTCSDHVLVRIRGQSSSDTQVLTPVFLR